MEYTPLIAAIIVGNIIWAVIDAALRARRAKKYPSRALIPAIAELQRTLDNMNMYADRDGRVRIQSITVATTLGVWESQYSKKS